ncbi:MAG: redoxin domain-containing protein [Thermodesulfobacteriota bacterium]
MNNRSFTIFIPLLAAVVVTFNMSAKEFPEENNTRGIFDSMNRSARWPGRFAPDFELELLGGERFRLSENIGKKVIILNFFATWCGPCKDEMPELNAFYEKHSGEPFVIIGIDGGENEDTVREFLEEYPVDFPVGIDVDRSIRKAYAIPGYPTTVLIGADGKVHLYEVGEITNADVAFHSHYGPGIEAIKSGEGIGREAYLEGLGGETPLPIEEEEKKEDKKEEYLFSGRKKAIVEKMYCSCGCSDHVSDCKCKMATDIKDTLKDMDISGRTDKEVITGLNEKFCVKDG